MSLNHTSVMFINVLLHPAELFQVYIAIFHVLQPLFLISGCICSVGHLWLSNWFNWGLFFMFSSVNLIKLIWQWYMFHVYAVVKVFIVCFSWYLCCFLSHRSWQLTLGYLLTWRVLMFLWKKQDKRLGMLATRLYLFLLKYKT